MLNTKNIIITLIAQLTILLCTPSKIFGQNLHLKVIGSDSVSKNYLQLNKYNKKFDNIKLLNQETTHIKQNLFNDGYFNHTIQALRTANDSTRMLELKLNFKYEEITICHFNKLSKKELKKILSPNTKISDHNFISKSTELESNLNAIIKHLIDKGKTFSSLQLQNIKTIKDKVFGDLQLSKSKDNHISNIIIKGYEKFPKKFINHFLKIRKNNILNITEIENKTNRLNQLIFSRQLKKPELLFTKDNTTLYLYLEKQKSNNFEGYLGFESNPETQKIAFNGNIKLKLINNLNRGEELRLNYLSTANEQKKININIKIPYVLNSRFSIDSSLDIFKKDSAFTNNSQTLQLKYPLNQKINIGIGARFTRSTTSNTPITNLQNFSKNEYLLTAEHIKLQEHNLFREKNKSTLEIGIANRETIAKKTPQESIYLKSSHILNLNKKNSIYINSESYYIKSDSIFENEQRFIGGINSIRGFQENSIPSSRYSYLNTEYRIQLTNNIYTHSVIDIGISKNNNKSDNLYGFGFGFGIKNKNNLLRFIFANSKTNTEKIRFSNSQIHLSLNTSF